MFSSDKVKIDLAKKISKQTRRFLIGWRWSSRALIGRVWATLRNERGDEGADEGPGSGKKAHLSGGCGLLLSPPRIPFLVALIFLHPIIHQSLLKGTEDRRVSRHRCPEATESPRLLTISCCSSRGGAPLAASCCCCCCSTPKGNQRAWCLDCRETTDIMTFDPLKHKAFCVDSYFFESIKLLSLSDILPLFQNQKIVLVCNSPSLHTEIK